MASDRDLVSLLDRVRTPFNVNGAAQAAALAALNDTEHLEAAVFATNRERDALAQRCRSLESARNYGLRIAPSRGNFLFIDTARSSREVADALMKRGVIVKPWIEAGFDTFIRVTVGRPEDSDGLIEALEQALDTLHPRCHR